LNQSPAPPPSDITLLAPAHCAPGFRTEIPTVTSPRPTAANLARLARTFAAGALLAAGCQSSGPRTAAPDTDTSLRAALQKGKADPPITPIATIDGQSAAAATIPNWAKGTDVNVQSVLDQMATNSPGSTAIPQPPILATNDSGTGAPEVPTATVPPAAHTPPPVIPPAPPPAVPEKPFEQRLDETTLLLTDMMLKQAAQGYSPALGPWKTYVALAGLEVVRPGSFPQVISPKSIGATGLSQRDYAAAESLREFLKGVSALTDEAGPGSLADGVAQLAEKIDSRPMRIQTAELCSKVGGFGRYTTLGTRRFLQGRPVRAIVYVEVARFANKVIDGGSGLPDLGGSGPKGGYAVELSQTLELFHDSDGLLTWRRPEETVLETSRNLRRDFYLVHEVTLPATLSNGIYRLKVTIRDKTTGQEDQAVIPLEVVSDPALAYQPTPGLSD